MKQSLSTVLSSRHFSREDQNMFAQLSGDFNPIHMDQILARRTLVGAPVVHGIHTTLWCLDVVSHSLKDLGEVNTIDVIFPKPLYLEEIVTVTCQSKLPYEINITAEVQNKTVAVIRITIHSDGRTASSERFESETLIAPNPTQEPEALPFDKLSKKSGIVDFVTSTKNFTQAFPHAAASIGSERLREIGACSRLVGMNCPGLRSIFSRLTIECINALEKIELEYQVTETHPRINLIKMDVSGAKITGRIEAFSPPPPASQQTVFDISQKISELEFENQTALIIGGSRGLGEVTAKIIAAGGGHVIITYKVGKQDALRIAEEIREFGGKVDTIPYDVTKPAAEQLAKLNGLIPSHLYYFATPHIGRAKSSFFDQTLFNEFVNFYLNGFQNLCRDLAAIIGGSLSVLYPSTIYINDPPRDLTEYGMAKAAGEILCISISKLLPNIKIFAHRLPRLSTDQNISVASQNNIFDPMKTLLPIIRDMQ